MSQLRWVRLLGAAFVAGLFVAGCAPSSSPGSPGSSPPSAAPVPSTPKPATPASQAVVEQYLRAATQADGDRMNALLAGSERKDHDARSLRKDASENYSSGATWQVLKTDEQGDTSEVTVDIKGGKVDPNPFKFVLTREAGEWRIVKSPEVKHDEHHGPSIHIRL